MSSSSPGLAFPRAARLLRPDEFAALRRSGKRISVRHFQCEFRLNETPTARLGMAVSRRVSKLAVVRNRVRRQIRESFRLCRRDLPFCDVLVIARVSAAELDNAHLRRELDQLWHKLKQIAGEAAATARDPAAAPLLNPAEGTGTMRDRV
ncbi:MAG: ribonuclease P protein component [Rudaea sp.]|uniref:ribonuclease P protein component n=1 Tax=unclassified Rudaea TaxID=2627037 RepID=UPI0010F71C4E|nr:MULTISPECIES: ribonuclease P protein component [unclassified Rudaea]MBN8885313.1 ribonuclease P protein component [Rudaea sp.]MBR0347659.1 ribonuclease P protein component [Rudaea sp.]